LLDYLGDKKQQKILLFFCLLVHYHRSRVINNMLSTLPFLLVSALSRHALAAPTQLEGRAGTLGLLSSLNTTNLGQVESTLENIVPLPSPTSVEQAASRLQSAYAAAAPTSFFQSAAIIIQQGLASNDLASIAAGFNAEQGSNSFNNNPHNPTKSIYPKKAQGDAPYQQTEAKLRQHIYIPPGFTFGKKPPVILVPGTGERGGGNFIVGLAGYTSHMLRPVTLIIALGKLDPVAAGPVVRRHRLDQPRRLPAGRRPDQCRECGLHYQLHLRHIWEQERQHRRVVSGKRVHAVGVEVLAVDTQDRY